MNPSSPAMDSNPLPNTTNQTEDKKKEKNKQKLKEQSPPPQQPNTASPTTSPSHEFSFTISLHSNSSKPSSDNCNCKTPNNSFAIDLSPADEIFFHGHLLPLHLLSHLQPHPSSSSSISPRSSTSSAALPIITKDIILNDRTSLDHVPPIGRTTRNNNSPKHVRVAKKSKSFSLFGLPGWKQSGERDHHESSKRKNKQMKFSRLLKRYMAMVKKSFKQQMRRLGEDDDIELYIDRDSSYSFSGQINSGGGNNNNNSYVKKMKKKKEFSSAPASMRTSPNNSGLLVPVPTMHSDNSSTMEELQVAIQAAITHCKNSVAKADEGGKLVKA